MVGAADAPARVRGAHSCGQELWSPHYAEARDRPRRPCPLPRGAARARRAGQGRGHRRPDPRRAGARRARHTRRPHGRGGGRLGGRRRPAGDGSRAARRPRRPAPGGGGPPARGPRRRQGPRRGPRRAGRERLVGARDLAPARPGRPHPGPAGPTGERLGGALCHRRCRRPARRGADHHRGRPLPGPGVLLPPGLHRPGPGLDDRGAPGPGLGPPPPARSGGLPPDGRFPRVLLRRRRAGLARRATPRGARARRR